jgi:lipoate-protein ligase A
MAADETLLQTAAAAGVASLRFYEWTQPTLSLGYFQPEAIRHHSAPLLTLPLVRRPTGGDALVHHHELTYAFALPSGPAWQTTSASSRHWLERMHQIIAIALAELGVQVTHSELAPVRDRHNAHLCFKHVTHGDLVIAADKIVGSAQRRHRGALLQHGAVLLKQSEFAPSLPGISERSGKLLEPGTLAEHITQAWVRHNECALTPQAWTNAELQQIDALVQSKYTQRAWNAKR